MNYLLDLAYTEGETAMWFLRICTVILTITALLCFIRVTILENKLSSKKAQQLINNTIANKPQEPEGTQIQQPPAEEDPKPPKPLLEYILPEEAKSVFERICVPVNYENGWRVAPSASASEGE